VPSVFPTLKTGAIAQYPASKITQYSSYVMRFLDGTDQRHRQYTPLRRWTIQLNMLDEAEVNALEQFFEQQQGRFGSFSFIDPSTQTTFPNCSLGQDSFQMELSGDMRGLTKLVIVENKV